MCLFAVMEEVRWNNERQNGYKNEELSYYCHTDHALPITHYPPKEIFEMTKAALITGISGQDACRVGRIEKRTFVVKLHVYDSDSQTIRLLNGSKPFQSHI